MLQLTHKLLLKLSALYKAVQIETNGTIDYSHLTDIENLYFIVSPKRPAEETYLHGAYAIKLLFPFQKGISFDSFKKKGRGMLGYFIQPIEDDNYDKNVEGALDFIQKEDDCRLSLQIHKIIGVE